MRAHYTRIYDGLTPLMEDRYDGAGHSRYYNLVTGAAVGGIAARLRVDASDNTYLVWYHYNHLGTQRAVTDEDGDRLRTPVVMNAFGELRDAYSAGSTNAADYDLREFLTTKQLHVTGMHHSDLYDDIWADPDDHIYYFAARWYDPAVGRFVGRDPLNGVFLYAYCGNVPTAAVDPTGLWGSLDHWNLTTEAVRQLVEDVRRCFRDLGIDGFLPYFNTRTDTDRDTRPAFPNGDGPNTRRVYHCFDAGSLENGILRQWERVREAARNFGDQRLLGQALHGLQDCYTHWYLPAGAIRGYLEHEISDADNPGGSAYDDALDATRRALEMYAGKCCCQ